MGKLKKVVKNISNFVKRIIFVSVGNVLPCPLPYPVINTILSYLLPVRGAVNIGPVNTNDSFNENNCMKGLYLSMSEVFHHIQMIMFNKGIVPSLSNGEGAMYHQYTTGMVKLLVTSFEVLVETVKSTGLQISFEGLDIEHTGGEEEKV